MNLQTTEKVSREKIQCPVLDVFLAVAGTDLKIPDRFSHNAQAGILMSLGRLTMLVSSVIFSSLTAELWRLGFADVAQDVQNQAPINWPKDPRRIRDFLAGHQNRINENLDERAWVVIRCIQQIVLEQDGIVKAIKENDFELLFYHIDRTSLVALTALSMGTVALRQKALDQMANVQIDLNIERIHSVEKPS